MLRGERTIFEHAGSFREHDEVHGPFHHAYPGAGDTGLAAPEPLPESCSTRRFFRSTP